MVRYGIPNWCATDESPIGLALKATANFKLRWCSRSLRSYFDLVTMIKDGFQGQDRLRRKGQAQARSKEKFICFDSNMATRTLQCCYKI